MKKILCLLIVCAPLLAFATPSRFDTIRQGIARVLTHTPGVALTVANIGIIVRDAKTGKVLYQRNAQHLFTPASVQKTLTAAAALYYLKPNFRFPTLLLTNGKIRNHILQGNLIVKFSGDPELTKKQLNKLLGLLQRLGVKQIANKVMIDISDYNRLPYPPGYIWDDLSYDYAAPISPVIINRNKFALTLMPNQQLHRRPRLIPSILPGVVSFSNHAKTIRRVNKECPLTIYSSLSGHFIIDGCLAKSKGKQTRVLAVRDVVTYAKALVANYLYQHNIAYSGSIAVHKAGANVRVLAEYLSPPLRNIVREMLKNSDNVTTNSLLKKLGESYFHRQGTWQNGLRALKRILSKPTHIDFKKTMLADGAGLSRYNLLSPLQISKVLYFVYHHRLVYKPFFNALPIAGVDGTLIGRMVKEARARRIHAKTGSMAGVMSLAGFIRSRHNGLLEFVIMINGVIKPRKPYIFLEDRICEFLASARKFRG